MSEQLKMANALLRKSEAAKIEHIEKLEELVRDLWPRASFTMAPENRQGWKERIAALGIEVEE